MDKILVVDDIDENIELISRFLLSLDYEVIIARNGETALQKIQSFSPDLIILGLILPDMDGYEICRRLKSNQNTEYTSVLMVTAHGSTGSRIKALEAGADDFITKPFDQITLLAKVKSLLRIKHLSDQLKQKYSELHEKNKQMEYQLKMAKEIQRSLIQEANFSVNDVKFTSKYMPAQDVGGDLYDIIKLNDNSVGVFLADVSGHGIASALLTSMLKMLFRNLIPYNYAPNKLLEEMNRKFSNIFANKVSDVYAAAFYARIDTKSKKIYYSNAGHSLPLFVKNASHTADELEINGLPIGLMEDAVYDLKSNVFENDDLILFYTDGLCDCIYKNNPEEFIEELKKLILQYKEYPPEEIIEIILNKFYNDNPESRCSIDDLSIIICKM